MWVISWIIHFLSVMLRQKRQSTLLPYPFHHSPPPPPASCIPSLAMPSAHPVRLSAALHPPSTSQCTCGSRRKARKNLFAKRVQVRSGYIIFLSQSSDWYELVIRFWPTKSLHWPTVQIKGKLRSRRAKYNGSSLLCQQTAFPFLTSLFLQVVFTLQPE